MRARLHTTIVLLSAVFPTIPAAAEDGEPTEVWLREGANLAISASPDGSLIVFELVGRAWALDPTDGFAAQLSEDDELAKRPVLSPDGKLVAYETIRNGFHQVIVRNADGSMPRQVTFGDYHHRSPAWSIASAERPFDGNRLIMSSNRGGRYGTWEVDIETLDLQQLTFASHDEHEPAWNENGTRLAYVADTEHGTALYAVTPGEQPELLVREEARIRAPAWRPGGGLLTYVRQQHGENQLRMLLLSDPVISKPISEGENVFPYPVRWLERSLFLYTSDGHIRRRKFGERDVETIAFNARIEIEPYDLEPKPLVLDASDNQPVVGSNGRAVGQDGRTIVATLGDLWELRPDGTLLRQLTNDPFVDASPALSPDGRTLAFVSDRGGSLQIWLRDLESTQERRLTHEPGVALDPRWTDDGDGIEYLAAPHASATATGRRLIDIDSGTAEDVENPEDASSPSGLAGTPPGNAPEIPLTWKPLAATGRTVIRAGRIFDGVGPGYVERQEIIVDNDRITAIRPWRDDEMKDDAVRYIDASDKTVMPGLIDASVQPLHLGDERLGRKFLAYGVTTIREHVAAAAPPIERYESWASGRRIGPRLLMASTVCSDAGDGFVVRPVLEPALAQRAFRAQINAAAERGSVAIGMCPALSVAARVDLIANVHARGLPAVTTRAFPDLLIGANESRSPPPGQAGYDDFALVTGALEATVTTNLAPLGLPLLISDQELITGWQFGQLFTAAEQAWYGRSWHLTDESLAMHRIETAAVARSIGAALANGARVVTGSDTPEVPPGMSIHAELRLLVRSGLQPFQALRMATADAARAVGAKDQLGLVRTGAIADLVIVDGDPLDDIREAANITTVIAAGRPYSRRDLSSPGNRPASVGNLYNSDGNASSN